MLRVMTLLSVLLANFVAQAETILHRERSLYSTILVSKTGQNICLQFTVQRDQRNQSCMNTKYPNKMVFSYTKMAMAGVLFTPNPKSILVVGLGGGTLPTAFHALFPAALIDAIEIDPAVTKIARQYFAFQPNQQVRVHNQDARVWTKRANRRDHKYDLIVLDAFNGDYIPEHLMTKQYLSETKALLATGGTFIANTFAVSDLYDHESATYQDVFGRFINFTVTESANRVVLVPGSHLSDAEIKAAANSWHEKLAKYDVPIQRYAKRIIKQRQATPNWRRDAKVLTDQYAPANLLQNR